MMMQHLFPHIHASVIISVLISLVYRVTSVVGMRDTWAGIQIGFSLVHFEKHTKRVFQALVLLRASRVQSLNTIAGKKELQSESTAQKSIWTRFLSHDFKAYVSKPAQS